MPTQLVQLPDDCNLVGYKAAGPFQFDAVYRSEKENFTGNENEFVAANKAYSYIQIDKHTRRVTNVQVSA